MGNRFLEQFKKLLHEFTPTDEKEMADKLRLSEFFNANGVNSFNNDNYNDGHITGSAFVYDPLQQKVLLLHHKKLNKWFQPGGHSDGNPDILGTSTREILEETGIRQFTSDSKIFDIDIHKIPAKEGKHPEHYHYDVRFLFISDSDIELVQNIEETNDLKWVNLSEIFDYAEHDIAFTRVKEKLEALS